MKTGANGKLNNTVLAVCDDCGTSRLVTFRAIKNKFPICKRCKQPMRIKRDTIPTVPTTD